MAAFAYLSFLLTFVALGLFVHAIATGSAAGVAYGTALVVFIVAMIAGSRRGKHAWSKPVRDAQVQLYLQRYRGAEDAPRNTNCRRSWRRRVRPVQVDAMTMPQPLREVAALASRTQDAGFSGLLFTETGRTAYLSAAVAAQAAPGLTCPRASRWHSRAARS